ncbi:MAG: UDP-N-acetylglucosamine--N-acetylmuramyl-(pentapeptide) pyrophosphoryl-undecaprenol N-acetylglucosamine transferase [Firmicutes bacterium]|nr:UDP-N-acetylglucosamine--N-acetylmuramyl-(pentapeptide) pyrophosphoryl-undecaprenol N-acetylglucosamine transferase [Bacillota bacterium]
MRLFITGGGTAGHIYPAIAIAQEIEKLIDCEIFYVGISGLLEEKIAVREGYTFLGIESKPLILKPCVKAVKNIKAVLRGIKKSKKLIDKYKPDAVISTGGYVAGPICQAAKSRKVPVYIHESNAHYGITTRIIDRFSKITFYPFRDDYEKLKKKSNKVYGGIPIRADFLDRANEEENLVLSFGGSGGQKSINEAVAEIFNNEENLNYKWIHITGLDWKKEFGDAVSNIPDYAEVYEYRHDIYEIMKRAKVVIAGCGAQGLTEIAAMKKAAILIPKSYVKENHQYYNALKYKEAGAAEMITEDELNGEKLLNMTDDLIQDDTKRLIMSENIAQFFDPDSAKNIAKHIVGDLMEK